VFFSIVHKSLQFTRHLGQPLLLSSFFAISIISAFFAFRATEEKNTLQLDPHP